VLSAKPCATNTLIPSKDKAPPLYQVVPLLSTPLAPMLVAKPPKARMYAPAMFVEM